MDESSLYRLRVLPGSVPQKSRPALSADFPTFQLLRPHLRLRKLQLWIAVHSALRLTLKGAAAIAGLEPHHFSHTFHQPVGVPFGQWMRQHRAALALQALESGQYSIDRVAELVGYRGRRSLERSIRRSTGRTPAEILRKPDVELVQSYNSKEFNPQFHDWTHSDALRYRAA